MCVCGCIYVCLSGYSDLPKILCINMFFFLLTGLCTLVGIILYIGAITEEVGSKASSPPDDPKFQYTYGSSFMMTVASFILTELSGVLSVYLYISRHKHAYRKKQERLTMIEANERPHHRHHPHRRSRSHSREHSRDHSRDNSPSHSDSYFTYTTVSDTSKEMSNYTLGRDVSRHTISTTADTHLSKDQSLHSMDRLDRHSMDRLDRLDTLRRTTPV